MKTTTLALASWGLGAALVVVPAIPAEAHTAFADSDCGGVHLQASRYDPSELNQWSITIGGKVYSGTFGATLNVTVPVPQDGVAYTWVAVIDTVQARYDFKFSDAVGPCGEVTPPPVVPPTPPPPPVVPPPVVPPTPPIVTRHAHTHVTVVDKCNCYRDKVTMHGGRHVKIRSSHPAPTLWVFHVTGKSQGGIQYLLPSRIGGHHGWAVEQTYRVRTTNTVCPCKVHHTCGQLYPGYNPPSQPCRGKDC